MSDYVRRKADEATGLFKAGEPGTLEAFIASVVEDCLQHVSAGCDCTFAPCTHDDTARSIACRIRRSLLSPDTKGQP